MTWTEFPARCSGRCPRRRRPSASGQHRVRADRRRRPRDGARPSSVSHPRRSPRRLRASPPEPLTVGSGSHEHQRPPDAERDALRRAPPSADGQPYKRTFSTKREAEAFQAREAGRPLPWIVGRPAPVVGEVRGLGRAVDRGRPQQASPGPLRSDRSAEMCHRCAMRILDISPRGSPQRCDLRLLWSPRGESNP